MVLTHGDAGGRNGKKLLPFGERLKSRIANLAKKEQLYKAN